MIRVGIIGASGYTAIEAIEWLIGHPQVQILAATSRQADGSMISDMHPSLVRRLKLPVEDLTPVQIAERCDVAFSCLPHGASAHIVMQLLDAGCRVIDLSANIIRCYRFAGNWIESLQQISRCNRIIFALPVLISKII